MDALLGFHGNNGYVNTPQRYILSTMTVLFKNHKHLYCLLCFPCLLTSYKIYKDFEQHFPGKRKAFSTPQHVFI